MNLGRVAVIVLDVNASPFEGETKIFDLLSTVLARHGSAEGRKAHHPRGLDFGPLAKVGNDDDVAETTEPQRELSSTLLAPPSPVASTDEQDDGRKSSIGGGSISDGEVDV